MLQIRKATIRKTITLDDFMRLKKTDKRIEQYRSDSKAINFGFLFGASARTFMKTTLLTQWSEDQADKYIAENRLFGLKEQTMERNPRETPKVVKLLTCATDIRNKFFKTYPGLMERIKREQQFGMEHGYVRHWHGACRRTPELFFASKKRNAYTDEYELSGEDKILYGGHLHQQSNICANTAIQSYESCLVMSAIAKIEKEFKDKQMKSYIFGSVHDSIDFIVHKEELKSFADIVRTICEEMHDLSFDMPQSIDIDISDVAKGQIYKGGSDYRAFL